MLENINSTQAKRIEVNIDKFHFFVVEHDHQIYVPTNEGLRLVNINIDWISSLGSKKRNALRKRGFSFQEKLLCYEYEGKPFFSGSYSWRNWLILWGYFAGYRNHTAIRLLRVLCLAEPGIGRYL